METKHWRNLLIVGAVLLLLFSVVQAKQGGVTAFRDKIYDVTFVSGSEAWVVGYPGFVLHTTDAGASWTKVDVPTKDALFSVDFVDQMHGWIVGRSGIILATVDGGKTWKVQTSGITEPLFSVDFIDAQRGWAAGNFGVILSTADGGQTWTSQILEQMSSAGIHSIFFQDENRGWLVGEYPIWESQLEEGVEASSIANMFRTTDGGKTWQGVYTGVPYTLYDVVFVDENTGWAVGSKGILLKTVDGGASWTRISTDVNSHLLDIAVVGEKVWIAGTDGTLMVVEKDVPRLIPLRIYTWFSAIAFGEAKSGLLVGGKGTLLRTDDGGNAWK